MNPNPRADRPASACARFATRSVLLLTTTLLAVFGCADGGGDFAASGGTSGTGISAGPITGFGSAFVTDVEWELGGAGVEIDGVPGNEAQLRLGMVVRVTGAIAAGGLTGTATSIVVDDSIEGPIDANPTPVGATGIQFTIFGQSVLADSETTVFDDGATFAGLMGGDVVEVHGLTDENDVIVATRIELRGPGATESELKGLVAGLMTNIDEFMIGGVTIVYDGTTVFRSGLVDENDLMNGQRVEVEGQLVAPLRIQADVIELEDDVFGVDDADEAKLRGFVDDLSGSQFTVSGVAVDARNATFEPANLVLAEGLFVEVEGRLAAGTLVAEKVELEDLGDQDGDSVEIQAAVPVGGLAAFGPNTLRMLGIQVQVDGATQLDDKRDELPNFSFSDIAEGDWLEIRGVAVDPANGIVVATRLERDEVEGDTILQGPVSSIDVPTLAIEILGQPITQAPPGTDYEDANDMPVTQAAFFAAVQVNDTVKAKDENAADLTVLGPLDELEIED